MPDNGQGGLTVVAQVAAEAMGVPIDRVHLVPSSTDALPIDVGSGASRMTNVAGHAVITATDKLKEQLAPLAAQALNSDQVTWASPMDGTVREGGWRTPDGKYISLGELAAEMIRPGDPAAHAQATITTPRDPDSAYCVQGAEVQVDPETGRVELLRMVSAQDTGTIINAIGHQGQIEGGLIQGVGYALSEELTTEEGRITNGHLSDYKMPTLADVPELTTINLEGASGPGPFGARAIGEIPIIPTAGAIANAVADAIGAPIFELPITPERVLAALGRLRAG
jgi:CO/xanthine dehydrogenase Mo-binding subunit